MTLSTAQLEKYANVLVWGLETARSGKFKPYDVILVRFDLEALPLAEVLHRALVQRRWNAVMRCMTTPAMEKDFFQHTDPRQRKFLGSWDREFMENVNGNIYLTAPSSLTHLKDVDPKNINEFSVARKPLRDIMERREAKGRLGWTLCTMPTEELAKKAGLSLKEYTAQIVKACFLNEKDPVAKWKEIYRNTFEIKKWLNSLPVKELHLESRGCDLAVTPGEKRRYLGVSGHNIPSFEIFTSPDWRGTRGIYFSNLPSYRSGNYVKDVRLEFRAGKAVKASAGQGEAFLKKMLDMDAGACRLGEFSLTDRRFSKIDRFMADTLFDENFGGPHGNCHIAVGMSYIDTYRGDSAKLTAAAKKSLGYNDSALHWDLVNTEDKRVTALLRNGRSITLYEKGMFRF